MTRTKIKQTLVVSKHIGNIFSNLLMKGCSKTAIEAAIIQISKIDFTGNERLKHFAIKRLEKFVAFAENQKKFANN